jgi:NAD(P)-dependent dehydrogenase (short-subunit alcohol dehydrogenase family)
MHKLINNLLILILSVLSGTAYAGLEADKPTVLITGANRGIGLEFVRQYSALDWNIIATVRNPRKAKALKALANEDPNIIIEQLDVTDHTRIDWLADIYADQPIDILLSNAGLTPKYVSAFKRVKGIDFNMASKSFEINAVGPLKLSQAFMTHVAASQQKKIIIISSRAASFELGPKMPMMYSYRASKAALNMFMHILAFETPKQGVTLTLISPGAVNTMEPGGIKIPNSIEPSESIEKMIALIERLTPEDNGRFLSFADGSDLGW